MKFGDIMKALERITYKPGWYFSVCFPAASNTYRFTLTHLAPDANKDSHDPAHPELIRITVDSTISIDFIQNIYDVTNKVRELIALAEQHEQHEWLKVDGKHVVEPHPPLIY